MAFIRRVRTGSGATAVQIAEYAKGRKRIIAHLGSAHTEVELGVLMARARAMLEDPDQLVLDLDGEPELPVDRLLGPPAGLALFGAPGDPEAPVRAGAGRVVGTASRVLFDALAAVYAELGFTTVGDDVFRDLVIARLVEPTSLLDISRVLSDLGRDSASYATMRRVLARARTDGYRDQVAHCCFSHAATASDISLILYDVTTLYFEAEKEDGLRKVGYSNYVDVVVMPSLVSSRWCRCRSTGFAGVDCAA